jgi:tRNA(His) guanylyltransferase
MEQQPSTKPISLGDRMKAHEAASDHRLDISKPFLVRVDGKCFSTYTKPYKKPWDENITDAMEAAACELMRFFVDCRAAYTQSDEITLVFDAHCKNMFDGRIAKITSLAASVAATAFVRHILANPDIPEKTKARPCNFDGRAFNVDDLCEATNNLVWRCGHDCVRNSRLNFGSAHIGRAKIKGMSCKQIVEVAKEQHGVNWEELPPRWKYGTLFKWSGYWCEDRKAQRRKIVGVPRLIERADETTIKLVCAKTWEDATEENGGGDV